MEKEKSGKIKQHIARSAVALTTAAALITAGLFHSPTDIVKEENAVTPPAIVETVDREMVPDEPEDLPEQEEERKKTLKEKLRELLLRMPLWLRILLLLPLWGIGTALLAVLSPLFQTVLPPLLNILLKWALIAAVLLGLVTAALKMLFPDMPLKKVLSKRNVVLVVVFSALVGISGWVLEDLYPDRKLLVPGVYAGAAALFVGVVLLSAAFRARGKKTEAAP